MKVITKEYKIPAGWVFSDHNHMVEFIHDINENRLWIYPRASFRNSFVVKRESKKIEVAVVDKK